MAYQRDKILSATRHKKSPCHSPLRPHSITASPRVPCQKFWSGRHRFSVGYFFVWFYRKTNIALGRDSGRSPMSDWMRTFSDDTKIVALNLPGTHNSATCTRLLSLPYVRCIRIQGIIAKHERQRPNDGQGRKSQSISSLSLLDFTRIRTPALFRCQERSLLQSLNDGIRVLDLRLGYKLGNQTIGFYHGANSFSVPPRESTDTRCRGSHARANNHTPGCPIWTLHLAYCAPYGNCTRFDSDGARAERHKRPKI